MQQEIFLQPLSLATGQVSHLKDDNAIRRKFGPKRTPPRLLRRDKRRHSFADAFELFGGRSPVIRNFRNSRQHLADKARYADHEEFVKIVSRDRQEPKPLEQRMVRIGRLLKTRRLNSSHDNSRLMNRSGEDNNGGGSSFAAMVAVGRELGLDCGDTTRQGQLHLRSLSY